MRAFAHRKVLVLNKNFTAIGVVSLPRAIVMLFSTDSNGDPKAEVIDHQIVGHYEDGRPQYNITPYSWEEWSEMRPKEGEDAIHACRGVFRIPEIIKLSQYDKLPTQKIHFSRRTIYKRAHSTCQYCKKKFGTEELSIDHIHPRSCGGQTTWENCVLSCVYCNKCKADRVPTVKQERIGGKLKTVYTVSFKDGKKTWSVHLVQPNKPSYNFFRGDIHYESWKQWLDAAYWNVELANDNKD